LDNPPQADKPRPVFGAHLMIRLIPGSMGLMHHYSERLGIIEFHPAK
jgi:hypothetical protein